MLVVKGSQNVLAMKFIAPQTNFVLTYDAHSLLLLLLYLKHIF